MALQLWKSLTFVLKFSFTISAPLLLFGGLASFSLNDVYVWYMMDSKSLLAAASSYLCIIVLYVLALPVFFSKFYNKEEKMNYPDHYYHQQRQDMAHEVCHSEDKLATALALALQRQSSSTNKKKKKKPMETDESSSKVEQYFQYLESMNKLKVTNTLTNDEFESLKKILVEKLTNILKR